MSQLNRPVPKLVVPGYRYLQDTALLVYLEGVSNYTQLHLTKLERPLLVNATTLLPTTHAVPLLVTRTLRYFEEQLPHFIRISKSLLVNPLYMAQIVAVKGRSMEVYLLDGTILDGSRRRILETTNKFRLYQDRGS